MVSGERRLRIVSLLVSNRDGAEVETRRVCEISAEVTGMNGAGVMLMSGDVPRGSMCTSNAVSALIEQLQYSLGQGPCIDAYSEDRPVLEPDLARPARPAGWPSPNRSLTRESERSSASRCGSERCGSARSTCTGISQAHSLTSSTPTPWSWPTSPPS